MILEEKLYDPNVPPEERGKGAWDRTKPKRTSLGKRSREDSTGEKSKRKLRRTASTKLSNQNDSMWGDIVGGGGTVLQVARSGMWDVADETPPIPNDKLLRTEAEASPPDPPTLPNTVNFQSLLAGFFSGSRFYFHGFNKSKKQILCNHMLPQDAEISSTLEEFLASTNQDSIRRFRVVPSDLAESDHPDMPLDRQVETVTEWWVERCLHYKKFVDPKDHVIGRPFPLFPIPEFKEMTISSAAFAGIDLLHMTKAVELLGAKYSEAFTKQSSILLTKTTIGLRKDKLSAAQEWKIPIVDAIWLWDSIEAGTKLPLQKYRFRGQKRARSQKMSENPFKPDSQVERSKQEAVVFNPETASSNSTARP